MQRRPGGAGSGWRALPVGPGGVPPEQVRPVGPVGSVGAGAPPRSPAPAPASTPGRVPWSGPPTPESSLDPDRAAVSEPRAVLGWFGAVDPFARVGADGPIAGEDGPDAADTARRRRRAVLAVACLGLVALAVVLAGLLTTAPGAAGSGSAVDLNPGDCLASAGGTTVIALECDAPEAEFVIAARFDRTADDGRCVATGSDVVLVTRDDAVMCLNYVARVGECLYAGDTDDIGKAPCREAGSPARGLFRVIAVLTGTVSGAGCPAGTLHTLVHRADREVVCLGLP
ncbi:LppU/SCO3897 family protein [Nakamurella sp.]|uniref:LppU/SCO3897 family protein n=1 Tax=Nakamurella sp. TaxID=1869182 RepID=UPI003B3B0597